MRLNKKKNKKFNDIIVWSIVYSLSLSLSTSFIVTPTPILLVLKYARINEGILKRGSCWVAESLKIFTRLKIVFRHSINKFKMSFAKTSFPRAYKKQKKLRKKEKKI